MALAAPTMITGSRVLYGLPGGIHAWPLSRNFSLSSIEWLKDPTPVDVPRRDITDRYFTFVQATYDTADGLANGSCLIFRRSLSPAAFLAMTGKVARHYSMRSYEVCSRDHLSYADRPEMLLPTSSTTVGQANTGATAIGSTLVAYTGGVGPIVQLLGVASSQGGSKRYHTWRVNLDNTRHAITTTHRGCSEVLMSVPGTAPGHCHFDSLLSVVAFKGKLLLYTRSNLHPVTGGRFVQMAGVSLPPHGAKGIPLAALNLANLSAWSEMTLLKIIGYNELLAGNMYMFNVNNNPADESTLIAFFPVHFGRRLSNATCLAMSFSLNGVLWSPIVSVLHTLDAGGGRTLDHPVGGLLHDGDQVYFFVHHNVSGVWEWPKNVRRIPDDRPSGIVRYSMRMNALRMLTKRATVLLTKCALDFCTEFA